MMVTLSLAISLLSHASPQAPAPAADAIDVSQCDNCKDFPAEWLRVDPSELLDLEALPPERRLDFLIGLFAKGGASLLAGGDKKGTNFLKLLLEYGRVGVLPEIATHFEALKAETENVVDVTVTAASAISTVQQDTIANALRERLGRDVNIETQIDETLIGGAVITAGDVVIDGSLRARLDGLATALIK